MRNAPYRSLSLPAGLFLTAALAVAPEASSQCSAPRDPAPGVCPIVVAGANAFDRCFGALPGVGQPTDFGRGACNVLRDSNALAQNLGRNAERAVNDARRDMQDLVNVVMRDAINQDAASRFVAARREVGEAFGAAKTYVNDPMCGVNGTIKGAQTILAEVGRDLGAAGGIAAKTLDAAKATGPAVQHAGSALTQLAALAAEIRAVGAAAEAERRKLEDALKSLQKNAGDLVALDLAGTAGAGVAMVAQVGPFVASAGACAQSLATAVSAAGATIGELSTGTAACPESGGAGCVFGVGAGVVTGTVSGLSAAVSGPACGEFNNGVARWNEHVQKISDFFNGATRVAQGLQKSVTDLQAASSALVKLAQNLGPSSKARTDAIDRELQGAAKAVNAGIDILERQVVPATERLTNAALQQTATHVANISVCFNRMSLLVVQMGTDFVQGVGLATEASLNLVDGGQIFQNLSRQGTDAVGAAARTAQTKWDEVNSANSTLHRDLWGVSPGTVDLPRTAVHMATLNLSRINRIADDIGRLASKLTGLVTASVDAGKAAFLNRDQLKTQSRAKSDTAESKSRSALIEIARAKAKVEMRRQAQVAAPRLNIQVQRPQVPRKL